MLAGRKLYIDTMSEVYTLLKPWADVEFWDFASVDPEPGAIYLFGRQHFLDNKQKIIDMAESRQYIIIFGNSAEGSWTLQSQVRMLGIEQLIIDGKLLLISGGDQQDDYPYIQHEWFLSCILNYDKNVTEMQRINELYAKNDKPYKFLFLNGRARPHRKYLYERFKQLKLLDQSLWTMLDSRPSASKSFSLLQGSTDLMRTTSELRWLPTEYEVDSYQNSTINPGPVNRTNIKHELFNNTWGEIYLKAEPYIDTYFSLVTETVVEQLWSFRTEKIAKPIMIGHPFIVVSNPGYYRDLRNLGFKTFGHVIDESFDSIENHQDRVERIIDIVQDLCQQDLAEFQNSCYTVCKYNQQHLIELGQKINSEFPERFDKFINQHE